MKCLMAVLAVSSCIWASDFSPSNLIRIPTGYTNGRTEGGATLPFKSRLGLYVNNVNRIETGLDIKQDHTGVSLRGDLKLRIVDAYGARCAVGIKDISPKDTKWNNIVYVVATRELWGEIPFWITLGAGSGGFFRRAGEDYSGIFAGVRSLWFYSKDYNLSYIADYDGYDINMGFEYAQSNWWAQIYTTDIEFRGNTTYGAKLAWRPGFLDFKSGESGQKQIFITMAGAMLSLGVPTIANEGFLTDCFINTWNNGDEWLSKSNRMRHVVGGSGVFLVSSAVIGQIPLFYSGQATERDKIEVVKKWGVATAVFAGVGKELYDFFEHDSPVDGLDIFMTGAGAWLTANWNADKWIGAFMGKAQKLYRIFRPKREEKKERKEKDNKERMRLG